MENNIISLDSIQIASPCNAEWKQMTGDNKVRLCGSCDKNVYNISALTRAQAEALIQEKEGNLCVRLHRRADGTLITSDCPVGAAYIQPSAGFLRGVVGPIIAAILFFLGLHALGNSVLFHHTEVYGMATNSLAS